ncbi:unnamed protein product [Eruca vesicaria subsp. sativa]|uniref:Uncharacterized protein n=1 Tax=Eruca vesicaria subsp. sativa TaxID=29727 RepID=A0ABC8IV17_ERUVS|nr:unnamed protein product [Eruca vesicaria subsp. sativa]
MAFFIITILVSYAYSCLVKEDYDDEPLVNPSGEFDTLDVISPVYRRLQYLHAREHTQKYVTYLDTCVDKMGPSGIVECNDDVLREILTNKLVSRVLFESSKSWKRIPYGD